MACWILVCRNTLQRTATHCNTLHHQLHLLDPSLPQRTTSHCNTQQRTATHCNALQRTATHCNALQRTATHCRTATYCHTLQHTRTHMQYTATRAATLRMPATLRIEGRVTAY